jgi:hypothetical protein
VVPDRQLPRPSFYPGQAITEYSQSTLRRIVAWVASDGLLRTDEELLRDVMDELRLHRAGIRIRTAIEAAIEAERRANRA